MTPSEKELVSETQEPIPEELLEEMLAQLRTAGGPTSGNYGHAGRPGQVGGSAPGGGRVTPEINVVSSGKGSEDEIKTMHAPALKAATADRQVVKLLNKTKVAFWLTDGSVTDIPGNEHLRGVTPRGWPKHYTWDRVSGCFNPVQGRVECGDPALLGGGAGSTLAHETGHAIEYAMKSVTNNNRWLDNRCREVWEKSVEPRSGVSPYFKQRTQGTGSIAGLEETFAESYSILAHGKAELIELQFGSEWSKVFHTTMKEVRKAGRAA